MEKDSKADKADLLKVELLFQGTNDFVLRSHWRVFEMSKLDITGLEAKLNVHALGVPNDNLASFCHEPALSELPE